MTANHVGDTCGVQPETVRWAAVPAPWGPINVAVSDRGVVAVEAQTPEESFVAGLERRFRREPLSGRDRLLDAATGQLEEYLRGERRTFSLPIDLPDRPAWDRSVLLAVAAIPWGTTLSYGMLARAIDRPGAARAVGGAVARSPIGIVIPCHRVIAADGTLGGYGPDAFGSHEQGLELKRELLALEGLDVRRRRA